MYELPKGMLHLGYHYFNNIPQRSHYVIIVNQKIDGMLL